MLLRDSMRAVLDPNARHTELTWALIEWALAAVVFCLVIGLIDGGGLMVALLAGAVHMLIAPAVLLMLRKLMTGRVRGK